MSFQKRNYPKRPKKKNRAFQKDPSGINNLMADFVARHGFQKQITSAMLVQKGNEMLLEILPAYAKEDVRVISFSEGELKIAVRHAAAKHECIQYTKIFENQLAREFPSVSVTRFIHVIHPKTFQDLIE